MVGLDASAVVVLQLVLLGAEAARQAATSNCCRPVLILLFKDNDLDPIIGSSSS